LSNADTAGAKELVSKTQEFSLQKLLSMFFPKVFLKQWLQMKILQLVVFSIFFGVAATALAIMPNR
jgi:Na+/H+-dicarboxylate symporter